MSDTEIIDQLRLSVPPQSQALLDMLAEAKKDTYRRIAAAIDNEITGDIFQVKYGGKSDSIVAVGTDGIKNIVFREMGFGPDDMLELG